MFQSEKKLSGSTHKINYVNNCFNLKRSCLVLLRRWTRQILGSSTTLTNVFNLKRSCLVLLRRWTRQIPESSTTLTNVSIWKEVVGFYSRRWTRQILRSSTTLTSVSIWKEVVWYYSEDEQDRYLSYHMGHFNNYFNKCFNLKRSCLVLLRRWTRQILGSSTTLTNVSIWKEVVWFYSEDEQDRYLSHQLL